MKETSSVPTHPIDGYGVVSGLKSWFVLPCAHISQSVGSRCFELSRRSARRARQRARLHRTAWRIRGRGVYERAALHVLVFAISAATISQTRSGRDAASIAA